MKTKADNCVWSVAKYVRHCDYGLISRMSMVQMSPSTQVGQPSRSYSWQDKLVAALYFDGAEGEGDRESDMK